MEVFKLSDRMMVLRVAESFNSQTVALASKRGIVVIDTSTMFSLASAVRERIETEFRRNDFFYVINSHPHSDHFGGNAAFPEAEVITHEKSPFLMSFLFPALVERHTMGRSEMLSLNRFFLLNVMDRTDEKNLSFEDKNRYQRWIEGMRHQIDDLEKGRYPKLPTLTFFDRMTLDLGDMTAKLYYFGRAHTGGDIIVHVPEEHMVFLGDVYSSTLGIGFRPSHRLEVDRWLKVLDEIFLDSKKTEHFICGHGLIMNREEFKEHLEYTRMLWKEVFSLREKTEDIQEAIEWLLFEKFTHLLEFQNKENIRLRRVHESRIKSFWNQMKKSVVPVLKHTLRKAGIQSMMKKADELSSQPGEYSFYKKEFDEWGFELLYGHRFEKGRAVFQAAAAAVPDYDFFTFGLGMAQILCGNTDAGLEMIKNKLESQNLDSVSPYLFELGHWLIRLNRNEDAISVFRLFKAAFPHNGISYENLGRAFDKKGDFATACKFYQRALRYDPDNAYAKKRIKDLGL